MGVATDVITRQVVATNIWEEAKDVASQVATRIRNGEVVINPIPPQNGVDMIQVVAPGGRILATSNAARDLPALSPVWPGPYDRIRELVSCPLPDGRCVHVTAVRATPAPDSPVVYAGKQTPPVVRSRILATVIAVQLILLIAFIGWVAWRIAGRALRPVEDIRAELAELTENDLSRRVPEPESEDEIARLARTANRALDRMEQAVMKQRQFAADASHELRTPIAGIRAQLESGQLHPDDMADAIEAALRDTDRLESIVTDLLFLARMGAAQTTAREEVDLANLVASHVAARPARVVAKLDLQPGVRVECVVSQLARAINELLSNADRHAATEVSVDVRRTGDQAELAVWNDGEPIPAADQARIFERFTRLDTARSRGKGGTGLGLAISREVVEAHGGTLDVESEPTGVRFVIRLPLPGTRRPGAR
ncbi:ATP-binding protein [Acrocarpospora sp. B8E8]|uniref:sensor histidine kinase n=1 Tax=Acrocarpospora sp. B8E8 TaxID=3153572 RepID=UPI00325C58D7